MSVVYITEQGSSLNKEGNRLVVKKGYNKIRWFHTKDIEQIILLGNITLTSPVITFLLKNKIDTVFLSYYGKYKGRLIGEFGKNIKLRLAQFNFLTNKKNQLDVSIEYIKTKIINQIQVLRKRNKHNKYEEVTNTITKLRSLIKYDMKEVDNLDSLRGIEGIAAKYYFAVFDKLITNRNFFLRVEIEDPQKMK